MADEKQKRILLLFAIQLLVRHNSQSNYMQLLNGVYETFFSIMIYLICDNVNNKDRFQNLFV